MNIVNLAAIMGDIPLQRLSLHPKILERLNTKLREEHRCDALKTGEDIERWFWELPFDVTSTLSEVIILDSEELKLTIHDITNYRLSLDYRNRINDAAPNRAAGLIAISSILLGVFIIMVFVFKVLGSGDKLTGVMYNVLVGLLKAIGWTVAAAT